MESLDKEDVVNLSSDASSGDCASSLEPVAEKRMVEKSYRKELHDLRIRLDKQTQDTVVFQKKCKDNDKEDGPLQHNQGSYKDSRVNVP